MGLWNAVRRTYRRLARRREDAHVREAATVLGKTPVFQGVPSRALRALAEGVHARTFHRDEFLYYEDDPGLGLYVVQQGRVALTVEDEHGEPCDLRQAGPGEVFGELSLVGDFPRMETARAAVETHVLGFFRPDLKTTRRRRPQAAAAIVEALAEHLAHRQVDVARRLAEDSGRVRARRTIDGAARQQQSGALPAGALADER